MGECCPSRTGAVKGLVGRFLLVCLGGALGSGARYLVATWALAAFGPDFPRGTLAVNVLGSFLLAVVMTLAVTTESVSPELRLLLGAGVMGGFTTYSSFNWETIALAQQGSWALAAANVALTLVACLAAGLAGLALVHWLVG
jgi:CrcB protein